MSIKVKLKPIKQLYSKPETGYRTLACKPLEEYDGLILNKYKNFTLCGDNLDDIKLDVEYELELETAASSKYPASYTLAGYGGFEFNGEKIKIAPEQELTLLRQFTDGDIADNIHSVYPNFVQMIVDGCEDEIDLKKIHNVGKKRFNSYCAKIKERYGIIKFMSITAEWHISKTQEISKLSNMYQQPEKLSAQLNSNPYYVFYDVLEYSFARADKAVLSHDAKWADSKERCEVACLTLLNKNEYCGHTRIKDVKLAEAAYKLCPEAISKIKDAVIESDRIYYDAKSGYISNMRTYNEEANIADNILSRIKPRSLGFEWAKFTHIDGLDCTDEQSRILELATEYPICMLRGYAGSGKSTAMKALVLMLENYHMDYTLLAPTGKAAKRLRETTGRDASTIHMFLINKTAKPDFVIVDESSMIGVDLLSMLFSHISPDSRVIMVCDEAQLTSISCGNIVQDMIDSGIVPTAQLTKVFRYGTDGLSTIATDTRMGLLGDRENSQFSDYHYMPIADDPIKQVLGIYESMLKKYNIDDIMVLSPYNKGGAGTIELNNAIQKRFNPSKDSKIIRTLPSGQQIMFKVGDKVINTKNNYYMPQYDASWTNDEDGTKHVMQVMNGDIGYVLKVIKRDDNIALVVKFDNGVACVENGAINDLLLGYAISVHKSQGSQSKAVIVLTSPEHRHMITCNLLYVADSRAEKELIEIGDIDTIVDGLRRQENKERNTWLKELLLDSGT